MCGDRRRVLVGERETCSSIRCFQAFGLINCIYESGISCGVESDT